MKKVSIITPVYNGEKYIKRCMTSVLGQSYKNIEYIVINDGSTDNTSKIGNSFNDERCQFISIANGGVSHARNIALSKATGEYVMFVDADDWLEQNAIELLVKKAEESNCDMVICAFRNHYENTEKVETIKMIPKYKELIFNILDETTNFGGYPWNKLIKREKISYNYNENIHYYENLLFFVENIYENEKYEIVNENLYNYFINDQSALHSKKYSVKKISQLEALNAIIEKIPDRCKDYYKYIFISNYYENLYNLKNEKIPNTLCNKYKNYIKLYYKDVIKSKLLTKKMKIKVIVLNRINFLYFLVKKAKNIM